MATTSYGFNAAVFVALLVAGTILVPFFSTPVFADRPPWAGNPHNPDIGPIGVGETSTNSCPTTTTSSSTRVGVVYRFKVPSTLSTIEDSGHPERGVNLHAAFIGSDGFYREVGLYYGDWRRSSGIGYDPDVFQFAWGRGDSVGGKLRGVIPLPVVAGHTVELQFVYFDSQGKWEIGYDDLNDGNPLQYIVDSTSTVKVKSDYWIFIESMGILPNSNTQALGLVEVLNAQKATKITGDGFSLSQWTDGFVKTNCAAGNASYGVDDLGTAHFKLGYGGSIKTNNQQIW